MRNFKISRFLLLAALCAALMCFSAFAAGVVYVADGGSGNGLSASAPVGTLTDAYNALGDDGGTVVVCGVCTVSAKFVEPEHSGNVIVTSKYGKTDYAESNGAAIDFYASYILTGDTTFENITLRSFGSYKGIMGRAHAVTIGEGVVSEKGEDCTYLTLIGGSESSYKNKTGNVVINSGTWQRVRGGTVKSGSTDYDVNITINGGTFQETVILASATASGNCSHTGNVTAVINGGTFNAGVVLSSASLEAGCTHSGDVDVTINGGTFNGVYGTAHLLDTDTFSGDISLTVNGGTFYQNIALSSTGKGTHNCTFDVALNGGEYQHIHEINGGCGLSGNIASSLAYGGAVDITAAENGKITFTNYQRVNADPFMFYHEGYYYYTATGGTGISLIKVRNISDVKFAKSTRILSSENYTDYWSPEIHYFSAEEIGEENAGWYMFVGAKEKDAAGTVASNQRQYVVKCLDGDNLLGRWGDPVTGEVNVLRKMMFTNGGYNEDELCGGSSPIRINGQVYLTFISEEGRGTNNFYQTVNITTFETPWNITGTPVEICRPEYDWEKHGSGGGYPAVVEGASAVYAPTGEVYLMYTGSGYWTSWYALGYLKLVGDNPLDKTSWQKNPTPVLQREETITDDSITGCGHGSYFTDRDGQMWVCYHGYFGNREDPSHDHIRYSFLEPIYVTADGVSIGNGSGHPAPLDTVYTINADNTSILDRASGFNTAKATAVSDIENGVTINFGPVEGAATYIVRRDDPKTGKLLYGATTVASCTDTEATPGVHTYYVMANTRGNNDISSDSVTVIARNNLRFKDVNGDGKFSVVDMLTVLRDFVNGNKNEATLIDIIQMLKCI